MFRVSTTLAGAALVAVLASACATAPRTLLLGAGTGAAVGGGTGLLISHNAMGTAIGAATGAITGGLIGFLLHKGKENDLQGPGGKNVTGAEKYPFLTRPEVRTIWVPDTVDGNRYIERHRVFVIDKNSSWSKDND
jgi:hypothetical protein